jgi:hypothetical protein
MKYDYAIRVLETNLWFLKDMVDVLADPRREELSAAIKLLQQHEEGK